METLVALVTALSNEVKNLRNDVASLRRELSNFQDVNADFQPRLSNCESVIKSLEIGKSNIPDTAKRVSG